jgi:hypothetical protein
MCVPYGTSTGTMQRQSVELAYGTGTELGWISVNTCLHLASTGGSRVTEQNIHDMTH